MSSPNKIALRKTLLQKRLSLSTHVQQEKAYQLASIIIQRPEFIFSRYIAGYWPSHGEISPLPLIYHACAVFKKHCYLPVLSPDAKGQLAFVAYRKGDPLFPNRFGILEPKFNFQKAIPARDLDLVLAPLVAFDGKGHRLGMGGGYYDRTFSFLKSGHKASLPYLLGLGYEFQQVKSLPFEGHDVQLNGIATEKKFQSARLV